MGQSFNIFTKLMLASQNFIQALLCVRNDKVNKIAQIHETDCLLKEYFRKNPVSLYCKFLKILCFCKYFK